jgi:uncharacterized protein (DUF433 family)
VYNSPNKLLKRGHWQMKSPNGKAAHKKLVREIYGGEPYEYYKLGKHIVAAPGVCGGRPTFKYTRIPIEFVLRLLAAGWTIEQIADKYKASHVSIAAVREAVKLAEKSLIKLSSATQLAA